ncbi:Yip1 family protein [Marinobacter similis]|uniref:Yip1 domain-containing protein n=1 Tax=Marinobacter similis TaxID=1420916 RepID=W5YKS9_9GAMM|nr:Yip1 family protein [Marinobacter similis]AHI29434.1 hypothetical protein AU14_15155 [Marinobacter similis]
MTVSHFLRLPLPGNDGWQALKRKNFSIPFLAWVVVLPMSLLPPVLLYFAGVHYGDDFMPGFADKEWRFITTILFLAELLTFFIMGWLIHSVMNSDKMEISYHDAYLLAAIAPIPLWLSSLALLVPVLAISVVSVLVGLCFSSLLIYQGIKSLCQRSDDDVVAMSATYTVMAASLLAWGILMATVWAF